MNSAEEAGAADEAGWSVDEGAWLLEVCAASEELGVFGEAGACDELASCCVLDAGWFDCCGELDVALSEGAVPTFCRGTIPNLSASVGAVATTKTASIASRSSDSLGTNMARCMLEVQEVGGCGAVARGRGLSRHVQGRRTVRFGGGTTAANDRTRVGEDEIWTRRGEAGWSEVSSERKDRRVSE